MVYIFLDLEIKAAVSNVPESRKCQSHQPWFHLPSIRKVIKERKYSSVQAVNRLSVPLQTFDTIHQRPATLTCFCLFLFCNCWVSRIIVPEQMVNRSSTNRFGGVPAQSPCACLQTSSLCQPSLSTVKLVHTCPVLGENNVGTLLISLLVQLLHSFFSFVLFLVSLSDIILPLWLNFLWQLFSLYLKLLISVCSSWRWNGRREQKVEFGRHTQKKKTHLSSNKRPGSEPRRCAAHLHTKPAPSWTCRGGRDQERVGVNKVFFYKSCLWQTESLGSTTEEQTLPVSHSRLLRLWSSHASLTWTNKCRDFYLSFYSLFFFSAMGTNTNACLCPIVTSAFNKLQRRKLHTTKESWCLEAHISKKTRNLYWPLY